MEMSEISPRLPRLLTPDLTEKARLHPTRAAAVLALRPLSTATLTLPEEDAPVALRDLVELYGPGGSLGIFRAAAVRTEYGSGREIDLEHGLCTLEDDLTPPGTKLTGSMREMLEGVLACQSRVFWRLGEVEAAPELGEIAAEGVNLLEDVLEIAEAAEDGMIVTDQSVFPWVLNIMKKPVTAACECRLNRNLNEAAVTLDDSALCTRVTVAGDSAGEPLTLDAPTMTAWGVVHRTISPETGTDPEAAARKYLAAHQNPALSVELDALALAELTGEPWDGFALGQVCRVALPAFRTALDERIVRLAYNDLYGDPRHVQITLSGEISDASSSLAGLQNTSRRNSGLLYKYYHEMGEEAQIVAERITLLAEQIALRATKEELDGALQEVGLRLDAVGDTLTLYAEKVDAHGEAISSVELLLDGLKNEISLKADKIDLQGYVTAEALAAELADFKQAWAANFEAFSVTTTMLSASNCTFDGATIGEVDGDTGSFVDLSVGGSALVKHSTSLVTGVSINLSRANVQGVSVVENATLDVTHVDLSYWGT